MTDTVEYAGGWPAEPLKGRTGISGAVLAGARLTCAWASATHPGLVRQTNQDAVEEGDLAFAVCDGMGGHQGGETASRLSVAALIDLPVPGVRTADDVVSRFAVAQAAVEHGARARPELAGMGSTGALIAVVVAEGRPAVVVGHMGDTRVYALGPGGLRCLTRDHTVVEELLAAQQVRPEDVASHPERHVLTRAIGGQDPASPELVIVPLTSRLRILATTDGVHALLAPKVFADLALEPQPDEVVSRMVEAALEAGAPDNLTCLVVDLGVEAGAGDVENLDEPDERTVPRAVGSSRREGFVETDRASSEGAGGS